MRAAVALLGIAASLGACGAARAQTLPEGDCAGVYWDLTALFATGDRLYARVLVTRAGPGERAAAGIGHWIERDGRATPFQNGRADGRFELDPSGPRLRIGSTRLDLAGPTLRFEVDNDKRGVKIALSIEAAVESASDPLFAGDPEISVLSLGRPVEGRLWRTGMDAPRAVRGFASLVRTRHRARERDLLLARIHVHRLVDPAAALLVYQRRPDGSAQSWVGWRSGDGRTGELRPTEFLVEDWRPGGTRDGTPLPRVLRSKGHALAGSIEVGTRPSLDRSPGRSTAARADAVLVR
jgi:hypothetical protein